MIQITLTEQQIKLLSKELLKVGVKIDERPITDRVESFEDAFDLYEGDMEGKLFLLNYSEDDKNILASVAFLKLSIIIEVLNEGWTPNWDKDNEYKYYPYFDTRNNTPVFASFNYWYSGSDAGSRLCLKTSALAEYCGKQFIDLYKDLFLI